MVIEESGTRVEVRKWDLLAPTTQLLTIVALVVALAMVLIAETDWVRYFAVGAVLVIAPVIGWLRGVDGPDGPDGSVDAR